MPVGEALSGRLASWGLLGRLLSGLAVGHYKICTRRFRRKVQSLERTYSGAHFSMVFLRYLVRKPHGFRYSQNTTPIVLLLLEPKRLLSLSTRSLVDAYWILETNRAILFGDSITPDPDKYMLSSTRENWPNSTKKILMLMIQTSNFANRLFDEIESIPQELRALDPRLDALAHEGLEIKERFLDWQAESQSEELPMGPFTKLAIIIYHALLLYHCGNFAYYPCWMARMIPQLTQSEVDKHVAAILDLSQTLLSDTDIPAVLLLFPLRMAGTHVLESHGQNRVLGAIRQIRQKGFVVSDRIELDLQEFWHYKLSILAEANEMRV
ncbi:uncharacterized protein BO97DRAFT_6248 [Aspergillus homomorphus CBS 101889]|uniref:Zn(II)2Cys6 transcription factor n=1 Tax=Aspergillus homomorphus (strain CBS 101889) TaxID=1450537 RepID=A0A395IAZ2_ASPHC|nr:hypothetical protein BO97DRAFT_6248 [Aspergillus homomorphus CBS 101889]RAL17420.1 hypothetical protein BO97DRAFT_6248 [Aspergillus homomorphus CBS 101889]